jgi:crotonobetainyl-CoA:carnitine CoA-transferase CaiB-like acyl-CoA transferase
MKPLEGFRVIDSSQFPRGTVSSAAFRDLGACVIKIDRPDTRGATR